MPHLFLIDKKAWFFSHHVSPNPSVAYCVPR